jgi:hypothetical protein
MSAPRCRSPSSDLPDRFRPPRHRPRFRRRTRCCSSILSRRTGCQRSRCCQGCRRQCRCCCCTGHPWSCTCPCRPSGYRSRVPRDRRTWHRCRRCISSRRPYRLRPRRSLRSRLGQRRRKFRMSRHRRCLRQDPRMPHRVPCRSQRRSSLRRCNCWLRNKACPDRHRLSRRHRHCLGHLRCPCAGLRRQPPYSSRHTRSGRQRPPTKACMREGSVFSTSTRLPLLDFFAQATGWPGS